MASARVTDEELKTLEAAAQVEGKLLAEWAREVLLRAARFSKDDALFTEVVATRMLLNNLLGPMAAGQGTAQEREIYVTFRRLESIACRIRRLPLVGH
jgi:hypothetical protein